MNEEYRNIVGYDKDGIMVIHWRGCFHKWYNYRKDHSFGVYNKYGCWVYPLSVHYYHTQLTTLDHENSEVALWLWTLKQIGIEPLVWPFIIYYLY